MLWHDDRTINKLWPLPHNENDLFDDVERIRDSLTAIDANIAAIETEATTVEDRQDFIETRLDVIAGSATEDTEILDARVDAEKTVHPNLGHNIRNIHLALLKAANDIRGMLIQLSELAEARIQGDINFVDAHERRKKELAQESAIRIQQDDGLQSQSDENAQANLQNALTIEKLNDNRKKDLRHETEKRIIHDDILQGQVDKNSSTGLQNALNIHHEAEQRREDIEFVHERIDNLDSENDDRSTEIQRLNTKLNEETSQRSLEDTRLDSELNAEIEVRNRQIETLHNLNERRKADIQEEATKRTDADKFIQEQVDTVAESELQASVNLSHETDQRRKNFSQLKDESEILRQDLNAEILIRENEDARLDLAISQETNTRAQQFAKLQDDLTDEATIRATEIGRLDEKITAEAESRVSADKNLQAQIDDEAQERLNIARGLAKQANDNAQANLGNTLKILDVDAKHKESLAREEAARVSDDDELQRQIDINAEAVITNALSIHQETDARQIADDVLGAEIDAERINRQQVDSELTQAINAESESRSQQDEAIRQEIHTESDSRIAEDNTLRAVIREVDSKLEDEARERLNADSGLAKQANDNATANLQNTLNILAGDKRIQRDLRHETKQRIEGDRSLQSQVDNTSSAALRNALTIRNEIEQRRQLLARLIEEKQDREHAIQNLLHEIGQLYEIPLPGLNADLATLQRQTDHNAQANISNALNLKAESNRRRENLSQVHERICAIHEAIDEEFSQLYALGAAHQSQLDELANAVMQSVFNLLNEVSRRKAAINQEATARIAQDERLAGQIDLVADGVIQNALTLNNSNEKRRFEDSTERLSRYDEDNGLQQQINELAEACMNNSLNNSATHKKLNEIEDTFTKISTGIATNNEVDEMLNRAFDN